MQVHRCAPASTHLIAAASVGCHTSGQWWLSHIWLCLRVRIIVEMPTRLVYHSKAAALEQPGAPASFQYNDACHSSFSVTWLFCHHTCPAGQPTASAFAMVY